MCKARRTSSVLKLGELGREMCKARRTSVVEKPGRPLQAGPSLVVVAKVIGPDCCRELSGLGLTKRGCMKKKQEKHSSTTKLCA